jgi:hypothetical protein
MIIIKRHGFIHTPITAAIVILREGMASDAIVLFL